MFGSSSFAHDDITLPTQSEPNQLRIQTGLKTITKTKTKKKKQEEGKTTTYFLQIILSWLYFLASAIREGSIIPPRSRRTRCSVDSATPISLIKIKIESS